MQRNRGVFNSDQVNKAKMLCPASELMRGEQNHYLECARKSVRLGMPVHIGHDMHRLVGWTQHYGLYLDSSMVRVLGSLDLAESDLEKSQLKAAGELYWDQFHKEGAEKFREELVSKVAPANVDDALFLNMEAYVVKKAGIAAELYPELFTPSKGSVDKDGLVDYRYLLQNMKQIQLGVFHDTNRDLLLFAHRFFRRSLSHRNKLNTYFLQSFDETVSEKNDLRVRIKLDPDILGHPKSATNLMELEYWRGPLYKDDIASIPNGVAEYKADESTRYYEGVDRTQVWWKAPESRQVNKKPLEYRTFEVEELIENPSGGLEPDQFGCRYAHAEFSSDIGSITHFDGAIRAYSAEAYLKRIDVSIDKAGKYSDYNKVFRLDGMLPIPQWKRLLSDFYRGNKLIPEYFGSPSDEEKATESNIEELPSLPNLVALISLDLGSIKVPFHILSELLIECGGIKTPYLEVGVGAVATHLRDKFNLSNIMTVGYEDNILNMSRLLFGASTNIRDIFSKEISELGIALCQDVENGLVSRTAIPLTWEVNGLLVTLTIAGDGNVVTKLLQQLPTIVDPTQLPSEWIEALSNLIKTTAIKENLPVMWHGVDRGVLEISRSGEVEIQFKLPEEMKKRILK